MSAKVSKPESFQTDLLSFVTVISKSTRKRRKRSSEKSNPKDSLQDHQNSPESLQHSSDRHESLQHTSNISTPTDKKKRTPPSIDSSPTAKKLILDRSQTPPKIGDLTQIEPSMDPLETGSTPPVLPQRSTEETEMESRLLSAMAGLIAPLQTKLDQMQTSIDTMTRVDWDAQHESITKLVNENSVLTTKIYQLERTTSNLQARLEKLEERIGGCNIIITGLAENKWEKEQVTLERSYDIFSELMIARTYEDRLQMAKSIEIISAKRLGNWNKLRGRPVAVTLSKKMDAEYIMKNRKSLPAKVYIDYEYDEETSNARRLLRPIFNMAKQKSEYKGKCKLEGGNLIILGKTYNENNLHELPDNLNPHNAASRYSPDTVGFFGELSPLSNFHKSKFTHEGITYHSSEQWIQRQKALLFNNPTVAADMLKESTSLGCKLLSKSIVNFDPVRWKEKAKELCLPGIKAKFEQNAVSRNCLLSTHGLKIVESSYDKFWGTGIPLRDDRCLLPRHWHTQGLLGIILEDIRLTLSPDTHQPPVHDMET